MPHHQLIVVGGGLAGLRAAVEAKADGLDVAILSQVHPGRSHSGAAQGGINAALANHPDGHDDTPEKHAFDTVKGSDYLADQDTAIQMTKDAPGVIFEMDHWGCPFSRFDDGRIAQRPFGGAGYPRTCYGADKTGHYLLHTLVERAYERQVKMYIEVFVTSLIVDDGRCRGVVAYDMISGGFQAFTADAVVMATGGAGRIYGNSTNAIISTGGGAAMAYHAGVPDGGHGVHPVPPHGPAHHQHPHDRRAAAARAATSSTTRASASWRRYAPKAMELAPRDITARSITDGDHRGPRHRRRGLRLPRPAAPRRREDPGAAAGHPRHRHPLRGRRSRSRSPSRSARSSTTRWAASTPTSTGAPGSPASTPPASAPA